MIMVTQPFRPVIHPEVGSTCHWSAKKVHEDRTYHEEGHRDIPITATDMDA